MLLNALGLNWLKLVNQLADASVHQGQFLGEGPIAGYGLGLAHADAFLCNYVRSSKRKCRDVWAPAQLSVRSTREESVRR